MKQNNSVNHSVGKKIKELREKNNLTRQELADRLFVSRSTISNWENDLRIPDVPMFKRLAEELGVEMNEILEEQPDAFFFPKIIVVEDSLIIRKGFVHMLEDTLPHAKVFGFQNTQEVLFFAESNRVDIAFLDIELSGESGIDLARKLTEMNSRVNIIFLTSYAEYAMEAHDLHSSGYVLKPLTPEKIKNEILHLRFPVKGLSEG